MFLVTRYVKGGQGWAYSDIEVTGCSLRPPEYCQSQYAQNKIPGPVPFRPGDGHRGHGGGAASGCHQDRVADGAAPCDPAGEGS